MSSNDDLKSANDLTIDLELRIDQICDAFELSYQRNENPRIEDFLDDSLGEVKSQLMELLMVELSYRKKAGDTPRFDEYATRFPEHSDVLQQLSDAFNTVVVSPFLAPPAIENLESFSFLGAGSFGSVWKAWDTRLCRFVAIKTPIRNVHTRMDRELMQREAQIVAQTRHPHVVPVHSAGEKEGRLYIVYDFISGVTLQEKLRQGPYSLKEAAALCIKIADALAHIHKLGIVHRDLKPANILLDQNGEPHVMDFGLAKVLNTSSTIGVPGTPLGTKAYMSPEQAAGRSKETNFLSDIFSLGAVLYEAATARRIIENDLNEFTQHKSSEYRDFGWICNKCLEPEQRDRYASASAVADDLQRFINGEPVLAGPISPGTRCWRWFRKNRRPAFFVSASMLPLFAFAMAGRPSRPVLQPGARYVHVISAPERASVSISPCSPETGEVELGKVILLDKTPGTVPLTPGPYQLHVTLPGSTGIQSHQVRRTVPGFQGEWPSMSAIWERSEALPTGDINWPKVELPPVKPHFEMALIEGTDRFVIDGPQRKVVSVAPFYVATREFTFGDFLKIRPGMSGSVPDRPAPKQRPEDTLPARYDIAEQWAEAAGCRLLTDIEFAYLASLAFDAQSTRARPDEPAAVFDRAGGLVYDEIPVKPPVRGILSGYAEWTSTWVRSPQATVDLTDHVDSTDHQIRPEHYRIIRGGTIDCRAEDIPREPGAAAASNIYLHHDHVGFRLARSADLQNGKSK
jgi:serine/threonine-protein kinase